MNRNKKIAMTGLAFCGLLGAGLALTQPPTGPMSFFVTSAGSGNGGNLGGLAGADAICERAVDLPAIIDRLAEARAK